MSFSSKYLKECIEICNLINPKKIENIAELINSVRTVKGRIVRGESPKSTTRALKTPRLSIIDKICIFFENYSWKMFWERIGVPMQGREGVNPSPGTGD